jgi:hypothetical protein
MFNSLETYTRERHTDLIREADMRRLARQAQDAQKRADPFYYEALASLGQQLTRWGEQLQERYSYAENTPVQLALEGPSDEQS